MADNLFSLKFIPSTVSDNEKFQYNQFMSKEVAINQEKLNFKTDCLDSFLYHFVAINADYIFRLVKSAEANFYRHSWEEL